MAIKKIVKNVSGGLKTWCGVPVAHNATYEILHLEEDSWMVDEHVLADLIAEDAEMSFDGTNWLTGECAAGLLTMVVSHSCGTNIANSHTPASASDDGVPGTIVWDSSYLYICTAVDTWKRVAVSSW